MTSRLPAFVNARAGTMRQAREALDRAGGFDVHVVDPPALVAALTPVVDQVDRVVVAGGDGTIGTAAAVLCGDDHHTALAVIPGGTLNHFAKDHGIPTDIDAAVALAQQGTVAPADIAFAGERIFLNTSAVGSYVTYVRLRDRIERYVGYRLASVLAAIRLFFRMRPITVDLEVEGKRRTYETPLVFIGVGERELRAPTLGSRITGGQRCLHVLVVRERRAARLVAVALAAVTRGIQYVAQTPEVDSFLVDRCAITVGTSSRRRRHRVPHIAVDGEIVQMEAPIEYRIARGALRIIVP